MKKIKVGILGATGMVGQKYIQLLDNHPWFEVNYLAASPSSAGKKYADAVSGRWHMPVSIPENVSNLIVHDAGKVNDALGKCAFVFSALEMDKEAIKALEFEYASKDIPVVSNASAHRHTDDVPMVIHEINHGHLRVIDEQRKRHGWKNGFVLVKPNCSIQSYIAPMHALMEAGYGISRAIITTMQALSGAGYPGVASLDIVDNIVPLISGEEEKSEQEPAKIFGTIEKGIIINDISMKISAHCNRVPLTDGHTACVSLEFSGKKPSIDEIKSLWRNFRSVPQELKLPSAPEKPIIYLDEINRPQPRKDRDAENGMAVSVGRLRKCNVLDIRFVGLVHNTIRGAAGGGILNAELLKAKGYL